MSHRASETTEANHLAPQVNWFQQQEDIKHLLFAFFVMGSKCVSQSLSLSFSRHTLLWVHTEDNQGAEKLKLLWSCNLLVKLRLIWNAANSFVGNICPFAVYSRGLFSKRRDRGLCQKLFLLCKRMMKGRETNIHTQMFFNHFLTLLQKDPHSDLAQWASVHWYSYEEIGSVWTGEIVAVSIRTWENLSHNIQFIWA